MSKKLKIKLKPGKAKIKLKSDDDTLPLDSAGIRALLGTTLEHAVLPHPMQNPKGLLPEPGTELPTKPEPDKE